MSTEATEPSVIARIDGRVGRILLNRPRQLNALDLDMIRGMQTALDAWHSLPSVHAVVIEGAGGKAFCAGGDIRTIRAQAVAGETALVEAFFAEEYALNATIASYPKPYIALIDGICMGGGIGVSVYGQMRITTADSLFAMPETAIALFPDVGATYMLPRLPGALGMYLALTGARLKGADAVHAGIATHLVAKADMAALNASLASDGAAAVAAFAQALPPFSLAGQRAAIDHCFGADSVTGIVARLEADGSDWAKDSLRMMREVSPSSVVWSFAAVRRGAAMTLGDALAAELKLTRTTTQHPDFAEGVRAMLVDKDRQPKWQPARIEDVDPAVIAAILA